MLKNIGNFLKKVCVGALKGLGKLLLVLGLWAPALFCIGFLMYCGITHTAFDRVMTTFIVGVIVSEVIGLLISYCVHLYKKNKSGVIKRGKNEPQPSRVPEQQNIGEQVVIRGGGTPIHDSMVSTQRRDELEREQQPPSPPIVSHTVDGSATSERESEKRSEQPSSAKSSDRPIYDFEAEAELRKKLFEDENKSRVGDVGYDYEESAAKRFQRIDGGGEEQPLVFRTRRDRSVYIYEFSNRLEIYRLTKQGMELLQVRYKK